MPTKVAVFGGSFDPPGIHHQHIVRALAQEFDEVWVVPSGPRPDKTGTEDVDPIFRAYMVDLTFQGMKGVQVDLTDLEHAIVTHSGQLQQRYADRGEVWHVVGADLVAGGAVGQSRIQHAWEHGPELWRSLNFLVVPRPAFPLAAHDLPPRSRLLELQEETSNADLRERIFKRQPIHGLVLPQVEEYIQRIGLYRGRLPSRRTNLRWDTPPRFLIVHDERNPKAVQWRTQFEPHEDPDHPTAILVLGGDGLMLHAIRRHWRLRVPFVGVNAGHLGFLLNDADDILEQAFPPAELIAHQLPLLYVETQHRDGTWQHSLAFNDTWVERGTSQTAWVEVQVDSQVRLPKLACDGVLLATAAGSTAYARAMGGPPLPAETPALVLAGSNVGDPPGWKTALVSLDAAVTFRCLDADKRPLNAFVDGMAQGDVLTLRARVSRVAAAELAFLPTHDMAEKIAHVQFP